MSNFFPDEVQTESVSKYTKLEKGDTKLRILGAPIFGYETWLEKADGSRSPKRFELNEEFKQSDLGPDGVKQFMAVKVYNYNAQDVQVWQVVQKTIMKSLKGYTENEEYGSPTGYDIVISKTGEGKMTRYNLVANPPKALPKEVAEADTAQGVDLDALFLNGDPFMKQS